MRCESASGGQPAGAAPVRRHTSSCLRAPDGGLTWWGVLPWGRKEALDPAADLGPRSLAAPSATRAVTSHLTQMCLLGDDGVVRCAGAGWGLGSDGQLGDGVARGAADVALVPVAVVGLDDVSAIAVGDLHSCALRRRRVWCWGGNHVGQLGDGTTEMLLVPVEVRGLSDVVEIASGATHQCALRDDGSVWCWGVDWWDAAGPSARGGSITAPTRVGL